MQYKKKGNSSPTWKYGSLGGSLKTLHQGGRRKDGGHGTKDGRNSWLDQSRNHARDPPGSLGHLALRSCEAAVPTAPLAAEVPAPV